MRVLIADDPLAAAEAAAERVAEEASLRPELVLGLPTGRTAAPLYGALSRRWRTGRLDLARAHGLNLDELVLPTEHPARFSRFMERHAWERIGLPRERCDIPRGEAPDLAAECKRYDSVVAAHGGLDLALLGIGGDGHVAYNLPGPPHEETHVVEVPDRVADRLEVAAEHRPLRAITMGMAPLRTARRLLLLALGADKAGAVRALLEGPATPSWPASLLRRHPAFEIVLAPEAAAAVASLRGIRGAATVEVG